MLWGVEMNTNEFRGLEIFDFNLALLCKFFGNWADKVNGRILSIIERKRKTNGDGFGLS